MKLRDSQAKSPWLISFEQLEREKLRKD